MVWHFLTARSQARQRVREREREQEAKPEIFEQYQSASAQWFFLVCRRWGRMFVRMIFAPGYVDWGWIFSETSWRVQCGSLAFWSAWSAWRRCMACMAWSTTDMSHVFVSFLVSASQIWETRIWMHVGLACAFGFRESRRFPKRRHHQPSRVVTGNCTTFFTCTATVLKPPVRYYRPGEKIYGNTRGQLLHCQWKGHNACLPDCVRNGLGVGKVPE